MTDSSLVTVVIPTHDRHDVVRRTIGSVLAQRGVEVDVVIVDDGSDPPVVEFDDDRVRVVRNERAQGVARARNRGVAEATGDWVAFLDDDDLWAPTKLESQLSAALDRGRSWAVTGVVAVDLDLVPIDSSVLTKLTVDEIRLRNVVPGGASNVIVRSEVLRQTTGFDHLLRHMADWEMWIQLCAFGPPAVVDEPLVAYVQHGANASLDVASIAKEIPAIERATGAPVDRAYVYRWMAWGELRLGHRFKATLCYLVAIRSGDLRSVLRALTVLILGPAKAQRRRNVDHASLAQAERWLAPMRRE